MASPSIVPTASGEGGLSARAARSIRTEEGKRTAQQTSATTYVTRFSLRDRTRLANSFSRGGTTTLLYYTKMETSEKPIEETQEPVGPHYDIRLPKLPWHRRMQIPIIATVVYTIIKILGPTLRFEVLGRASVDKMWTTKQPLIWAFWHRCIIPIAWYGRNRGIVVMNTTAFDGQWTRKVIEWLGFGTAQGSSSRGGLRGLTVMAERIKEGLDCAFTIDGPRGPRYVAKVGPVLLARMTGAPIMVFHVGVDRGKTIERTWDHFLLPSLFARAILIGGRIIHVPQDADSDTIRMKHQEMQNELERVRDIAEGWFSFSEEVRSQHRAEIGP